jgi:hypothetical protein
VTPSILYRVVAYDDDSRRTSGGVFASLDRATGHASDLSSWSHRVVVQDDNLDVVCEWVDGVLLDRSRVEATR